MTPTLLVDRENIYCAGGKAVSRGEVKFVNYAIVCGFEFVTHVLLGVDVPIEGGV